MPELSVATLVTRTTLNHTTPLHCCITTEGHTESPYPWQCWSERNFIAFSRCVNKKKNLPLSRAKKRQCWKIKVPEPRRANAASTCARRPHMEDVFSKSKATDLVVRSATKFCQLQSGLQNFVCFVFTQVLGLNVKEKGKSRPCQNARVRFCCYSVCKEKRCFFSHQLVS